MVGGFFRIYSIGFKNNGISETMREEEIMRQIDLLVFMQNNKGLKRAFRNYSFPQVVENRNIMEILQLEGRPSLNP